MGNCGFNCQARLSQGDVQKEASFDEAKEAKALLEELRRGFYHPNIVLGSSLEYILSKITGRKRIRFYNPLGISMVVWIYENPEELVFKRLEGGASLGGNVGPIKASLEVNAEKGRRPEDRLPVTQLIVPPKVTIPVYVQSSSVYVTLGRVIHHRKKGGTREIWCKPTFEIFQHNRLIPTSSIFIFRSYHLNNPIGHVSSPKDMRHFGKLAGNWQSEYAWLVS